MTTTKKCLKQNFTGNMHYLDSDFEFAHPNLVQIPDTTTGHKHKHNLIMQERPLCLHKKGKDRKQIINSFFSITLNLTN